MAYIGKTPALGNYQKCDAITTSATATYNLLVGSVAVSPETANNCIVSLNGVIQAPTDAYTISGSQIIFNSALTSADVIDFILILGDVLDIGTPSDDTVTLAKLASGTDGEIISWDASGNPVAIGAGSSGEFLKSQGAGSQPVFAAAGGGKILQVQSYSTATFPSQSASASPVDISSFLVTITPAATSSKILIMVSLGIVSSGGSTVSFVVEKAISGGATTLLGGTASSNHQSASFRFFQVSDANQSYGCCWNYLDSPSTTSAITYQLQWATQDTTYLNRSYSDTDVAPYGDRHLSGMMAMEVGA